MKFEKVRLYISSPRIDRYLPSGYGRSQVTDALNKIRLFRNRIYHNEPVCFDAATINFQKAENVHQLIKNVLTWCDPELLGWIKDFDQIEVKIRNAKRI